MTKEQSPAIPETVDPRPRRLTYAAVLTALEGAGLTVGGVWVLVLGLVGAPDDRRQAVTLGVTLVALALLPLLAGTMENLAALGLPQALTGPLSRGDAGTIARHLTHLDAVAPDVAGLYRCLGRATLPFALAKDPAAAERIRAAGALLETPV